MYCVDQGRQLGNFSWGQAHSFEVDDGFDSSMILLTLKAVTFPSPLRIKP
jgi:hypothetical protein